jgi:hypothetical protein
MLDIFSVYWYGLVMFELLFFLLLVVTVGVPILQWYVQNR